MKFRILGTAFLLAFTALAMPAGTPSAATPRTVTINAHRFAFEPNEITLKVGEETVLILHSEDVSHGLVIEDLGVRAEVKKGQSTQVTVTPQSAGTFEGKCAHFCGAGHGGMILTVHVVN